MLKTAVCIFLLSLGLQGADNAFCEAYKSMNPDGYKVARDIYDIKYKNDKCDPNKIKIITSTDEYRELLTILTLDPSRYEVLIGTAKQNGFIGR